MSADSKVLICLNHGAEDAESILISYLVGVESLRAGKEAVMFLTKDAVHVATEGFADTIDVPDAPSVTELHEEYVASGGRFFASAARRASSACFAASARFISSAALRASSKVPARRPTPSRMLPRTFPDTFPASAAFSRISSAPSTIARSSAVSIAGVRKPRMRATARTNHCHADFSPLPAGAGMAFSACWNFGLLNASATNSSMFGVPSSFIDMPY